VGSTDPPVAVALVLPAQVTIKLDSHPRGADIYDNTSKEVVGQTPFDFSLPGSREPRRFTFRLKGHGGKMIELLPVEDVAFTVELVPLGTPAATAASDVVEVVPQKARAGRKVPSAIDKPIDGTPPPITPERADSADSAGPVGSPSATPAEKQPERTPVEPVKPPEIKPPEIKPPEIKPSNIKTPADKPPDDEMPVLKDPFETDDPPAETPSSDKMDLP
jgi:hypothetical protein